MQLFLSLVPCLVVITAAGVALTMVFFAAIQRRVSTLAKAVIANEAARQAEASESANEKNELKRRIAALEKIEVCADPQSEGDLSSAVRGMALKLRRAGQAPDEIARKLRLSKGEVELLIKAQKIVMRPYEHLEMTAPKGGKKD